MKKLILLIAIGLSLSCEKEKVQNQTEDIQLSKATAEISSNGASQISGLGTYAVTGECEPLLEGAAYAIKMTGELEGCLYAFIDNFECSPSGTYRESGREYFVGTYKGVAGTFWTGYEFAGRYEGCPENGEALGAEIFGRCQHPIVPGSGEGVFEGVTGRLDFKDDIEAQNFPYRGHLRF
ncbi:hypothetical protein GZH53_05455 [Flavihumibacter sp. R14]|nr:hypothetical protein [Flavihumibacter soli]